MIGQLWSAMWKLLWSAKFEEQVKHMAGIWFALSNQTIVEQHPKENVRNKNMLKATKS